MSIDLEYEIHIPLILADKDFSNLADTVRETLAKALNDLVLAARARWIQEADTKLFSARRPYKDSIKMEKESDLSYKLVIDNANSGDKWLASSLEKGKEGWDIMRTWKSWKMGKGGLYKMIPMPVPVGQKRREGAWMQPNTVDHWKYVTPNSKGWMHPGFKPAGKEGLDAPLRKAVIDFVKKDYTKIFDKHFSRMKI